MSTNASIWKQNDDGTFTGVYLHWDGYIAGGGAGETLFRNWQDPADVQDLIDLGDLSSLGDNYDETTAYERDRGEDWRQSFHGDDLEDAIAHGGNHYQYFFMNGKWYVCLNSDPENMHELTEEYLKNCE